MLQALEGVVNKVKFMLIDSRVFADEVEPTGVVPMELSLEKLVNAIQLLVCLKCLVLFLWYNISLITMTVVIRYWCTSIVPSLGIAMRQ